MGMSFGTVVGSRTQQGRAWFRRYFDSAVNVPGPVVDRLGEVAARHACHLVIGVVERDGGTLYCTALTFGPDGGLYGKHRKLMPTAAERLVWGFGDGSTMDVYQTSIGRLGSLICWENYMPLARMHMYAQGVQIYCAPTADQRDTWVASMQHIACEGRCFVLSANQYTRRSHYPADYPIDAAPDDVLSRGASVIVDPLGRILAGPAIEGETVLRATLDLDKIVEGKYDFDVVGHYARPDVFQLVVDSTPRPVAVTRPVPEITAPETAAGRERGNG